MLHRKRPLEFYLGLGILSFLGAAALLTYFQPLAPPAGRGQPSLTLHASESAGRIRVDWDPRDEAVRTAQGGTLETLDGGVQNRYAVEPQVLRSGSFDYLRKSEDVVLTLTLFHEGKPSQRGMIRTVGPVTAAGAEQAAAQSSAPQERNQTRSRRR